MAIQKINPQDFDKILFKGRGKISVIFKALLDLKVGEAIKIDRAEWKKHYKISRTIYYIRKFYGYQLTGGRLADGSGWAYKREKLRGRWGKIFLYICAIKKAILWHKALRQLADWGDRVAGINKLCAMLNATPTDIASWETLSLFKPIYDT